MVRHEDLVQGAIVKHFRKFYAGRICHVPNGGRRGKLEAIRFKSLGVEAGHPDLVIYSPAGCFLIECKGADGELSSAQKVFLDDLREMGFRVAAVWTAEEGKKVLAEWKLPLKAVRLRSDAELRTGF